MIPREKRCEERGCPNEAVTTYQDKARTIWKLCAEHRRMWKRSRA